MPNWTTNQLSFSKKGPEILAYIKGEDTLFDFNKVIKMPDFLSQVISGSIILDSGKRVERAVEVSPNKYRELTKEEVEKCEGWQSWYDWSVANWGTKWNACEPEVTGPRSIRFDTAWSAPTPVLIALSEIFPDVRFTMHSDYEGGEPSDTFYAQDGVLVTKGEY